MSTLTAPSPAEEGMAREAIDGRALRDTLGRFATGVTVITTKTEEGAPVGITANSFSSLSLEPPLILWSLALKSPNISAFDEGRPFAVNILGHHQDAVAMQFARRSDDKFEGVAHRSNAAGVPLLEGTLARLECRVEFTRIAGDHLLIVGRVQRFDTEEGDPLVFYQGSFQRVSA